MIATPGSTSLRRRIVHRWGSGCSKRSPVDQMTARVTVNHGRTRHGGFLGPDGFVRVVDRIKFRDRAFINHTRFVLFCCGFTLRCTRLMIVSIFIQARGSNRIRFGKIKLLIPSRLAPKLVLFEQNKQLSKEQAHKDNNIDGNDGICQIRAILFWKG